ncbi:unnamed protein product [Euphydryas editha]|uniref:Transposable element P transposase-like GTP-binding insertion domain-containing protein n=1 Tax=Euphydryas editha TaxID=104508 RepID=A0AAU9URV3_EUPED|nr:unnamed protein product [Euphydryas editha]
MWNPKKVFCMMTKIFICRILKKLELWQEKTGIYLANRLSKKHLEFRNSIMNVKLATQLLNSSVSKAMDFCRKATEKFIMLMNDVFDIFNSRNLKAYGCKHPTSIINQHLFQKQSSNVCCIRRSKTTYFEFKP